MSMTEEKKKKSRFRSRLTFLLLTLAVILGVVGYTYRTDIEMHIVHLKPQPVRQVELGKMGLQLQRFNTPEITSYDVDKILSFVIRDDRFYIALRSQDGDSTAVQAYQRKEGSLFPLRSFGKKGTCTIPEKMVLSVDLAGNGDIVYVKKGIHTLRDGNDIISLKGNTTATRVPSCRGMNRPTCTATTTLPWRITGTGPLRRTIPPSSTTGPNPLPEA